MTCIQSSRRSYIEHGCTSWQEEVGFVCSISASLGGTRWGWNRTLMYDSFGHDWDILFGSWKFTRRGGLRCRTQPFAQTRVNTTFIVIFISCCIYHHIQHFYDSRTMGSTALFGPTLYRPRLPALFHIFSEGSRSRLTPSECASNLFKFASRQLLLHNMSTLRGVAQSDSTSRAVDSLFIKNRAFGRH